MRNPEIVRTKGRIKADIYEILSEQFKIAKRDIKDGLGPGDLSSWDSIGHLQFIRKLERHFNLGFTVYDIMSFNSVREICQTIQSRLT
jgi:acyl carrier protein